jgi:hypothetical protein
MDSKQLLVEVLVFALAVVSVQLLMFAKLA